VPFQYDATGEPLEISMSSVLRPPRLSAAVPVMRAKLFNCCSAEG